SDLHPLAMGLEPVLRDMHVEEERVPVFLGPFDVLVQPLPSVLHILVRLLVIFKKTVIEVEPDDIHLHLLHPEKIPFVMVFGRWKQWVSPDFIAKADPFQPDRGIILPHHKLLAFGPDVSLGDPAAVGPCFCWGESCRGRSAGGVRTWTDG